MEAALRCICARGLNLPLKSAHFLSPNFACRMQRRLFQYTEPVLVYSADPSAVDSAATIFCAWRRWEGVGLFPNEKEWVIHRRKTLNQQNIHRLSQRNDRKTTWRHCDWCIVVMTDALWCTIWSSTRFWSTPRRCSRGESNLAQSLSKVRWLKAVAFA